MDTKARAALEKLIDLAKTKSGQGRRVADFLLAWWNVKECGRFDMIDMWGLDDDIRPAMVEVFKFISTHQRYPDTLGYADDFDFIWQIWRGSSDDGNVDDYEEDAK
jgi:hypothetical protein